MIWHWTTKPTWAVIDISFPWFELSRKAPITEKTNFISVDGAACKPNINAKAPLVLNVFFLSKRFYAAGSTI